MIRLLICFVVLCCSKASFGYHHFMAMGYASCMTCHFNPNGNGPLNDYGRALFATELSSRWYAPKRVSDDKLGEYSQFLGFKELPYWIRPHMKYRGIQITQSPGSESQSQRSIAMQRELGTAIILDPDYKNVLVTSFTFHDEETPYRTSYQRTENPGWLLKEFYGRIELPNEQWLTLGFQDKPFGIRDANHTLISRRFTRNTQYDQSIGALYFKSSQKYEFSAMGFMGNLNEDPRNRAGGLSSLYEYNISEQTRLGASLLTQKNDNSELFALSAHSRLNLNYGAAFSFETGVVQNTTLGSNLSTQSFYWLLQNMLRLSRGVNFLFEHELGRVDLNTAGAWLQRTSFGFLIFPLPRSEFRVHLVNEKNIDFSGGTPDVWQMQTQFHLAL